MKKKDTFAARSKKIMAKYPRHTWDKLEMNDMLKELEALKEEQEMERAVRGIADGADQMDQMAKGGYMKYDGTNKSQYLPRIFNTGQPAMNIGEVNPYGQPMDMSQSQTPFVSSFNNTELNNTNKYAPYVYSTPVGDNSQISPDTFYNKASISEAMKGSFRPIQTSLAPYAVSAGMSAIGDIASLINMKRTRPDSLTLPRVAPTKIDLQAEREAAGRTYNTNRNIMLRNSRDVSSPNAAYANQVAGLSSLQDSYGTMMGQSYMNEANTNAQFANQANMQNAQLGAREAEVNFQARKEMSDAQTGMIGSLANTIPQALRDYRSDYSQNMLMNVLGKEYGLYEPTPPPMNSWQQFLYNLKGPKYQVLNRQYANQNIKA